MQSNQQINYLGEEKIPKLMLKFSIPCILSLLVSALNNIVDQIFIGNSELSALGNTATGVVFPIFILMNMMNAIIRADGSPAGSMASMLTGAIVNIILDPVFIFGLHWGMKGAAFATVIGQTVSFVISVRYFFHTILLLPR